MWTLKKQLLNIILFLAKLAERLQTEESLALQAIVLYETLCPSAGDPAVCQSIISTHWVVIGLAMYPTFFDANTICTTLQACPGAVRRSMREWTCEECTGGIEDMGGILVGQIPDIVDFLKVILVYNCKMG